MARSKTAKRKAKQRTYLDQPSQQRLLRQLARIEGHVRSIGRKVEERDWADEILLQVTAVKGALNRFGATLLEDELKACLACAKPAEREERIGRLAQVWATMLKQV